MGSLIIGALIVGDIWAFFSFKSVTNAYVAFNALDEAEEWLVQEGISPDSVKFSSYDDPALIKNIGATVIAGYGEKNDGSTVGFVAEIIPDVGVWKALSSNPTALCHTIEECLILQNRWGFR